MDFETFKSVFLLKAKKIGVNQELADRYHSIIERYNLGQKTVSEIVDHILDNYKVFPTPKDFTDVVNRFVPKGSISKRQCIYCDGEGVFIATRLDYLEDVAFRCPVNCTYAPDIVKQWSNEYRKYYIPQFENRGVLWKSSL